MDPSEKTPTTPNVHRVYLKDGKTVVHPKFISLFPLSKVSRVIDLENPVAMKMHTDAANYILHRDISRYFDHFIPAYNAYNEAFKKDREELQKKEKEYHRLFNEGMKMAGEASEFNMETGCVEKNPEKARQVEDKQSVLDKLNKDIQEHRNKPLSLGHYYFTGEDPLSQENNHLDDTTRQFRAAIASILDYCQLDRKTIKRLEKLLQCNVEEQEDGMEFNELVDALCDIGFGIRGAYRKLFEDIKAGHMSEMLREERERSQADDIDTYDSHGFNIYPFYARMEKLMPGAFIEQLVYLWPWCADFCEITDPDDPKCREDWPCVCKGAPDLSHIQDGPTAKVMEALDVYDEALTKRNRVKRRKDAPGETSQKKQRVEE